MTNLMNTANEILSKPTAEEKKATIVNIPTDKLQAFEEHPFKVEVNEDMHALVESIQAQGILSPFIVRPVFGDKYEIKFTVDGKKLEVVSWEKIK